MVKIGVLDYAQRDEQTTVREAFEHTIILAKLADELNFHRFWVAEHHNVPALANSSPEMLMMHLATITKNIRIGSGGIMMPHYSPLKVAENFRTLDVLHPNRIDLGVGSNSGTPLVDKTLNEYKKNKLPYETSIADLLHYLDYKKDPEHRFSNIRANPQTDGTPSVWTLSTGMESASIAAKYGIGYAFGLFPFVGSEKLLQGPKAAKHYKASFQKSDYLDRPHTIVAPFVSIADTAEEAESYAQAQDLWLLGKDAFGALDAFPSVETARQYHFSSADQKQIEANRKHMIIGDPSSVKRQLQELIDTFDADELLLIPMLPGMKARKRAYELLADLFQ